MKKIVLVLAACLTLLPARADEGMWMLPLLQKMNADAMRRIGSRLSVEDIYSINQSSLKDAVVHFGGGCTGEIISDAGLLVTNHHCGYSYIQALSSPEHNYLEDGFWASDRAAELPVPGLTVTFLQSMTDVTAVFDKLEDKAPEAVEAAEKALCEQAEKDNPHCKASVVSFYNDNVRYLIVSKIYNDVRFVGAPPASLGKFGGDTDNWMWPRHTCDFSMFRVYAGADNEPAAYAPENRPFVPKKSLKISLRGVSEGDFAMIMGYPGRTQRFQTAAQLEQMFALNEIRIGARTVRQEVLWKEMRSNETVGLQYASKYARSSNGWKKWIGMRKAAADLDIIGREQRKEAEFMAWVGKKNKRQEAYGSALADMEAAVRASDASMKAYTLLLESLAQIELVSLSSMKEERLQAAWRDYDARVDRKVASAVTRFYLERVVPQDKVVLPGRELTLDNYEAWLDELYAGSAYTDAARYAAAQAAGADLEQDPAAVLRGAIRDAARRLVPAIRKAVADQRPAARAYTAGLLEWKKGAAPYPDANSTCRLTYGTVQPYSPKDGVLYRHYTTLKGVMEKEDPSNYEFRVPARLKEIYEKKDYGRYADAKGELPVCFLTNCDITGGNSGSPVLNADGHLIGLAFDGNWESMSSDVMFEPDLQRCICVDIRYVLLVVDKFGGAGYLLKEMDFVK